MSFPRSLQWALRTSPSCWMRAPRGCPENGDVCASATKGFRGIPKGVAAKSSKDHTVFGTLFVSHVSPSGTQGGAGSLTPRGGWSAGGQGESRGVVCLSSCLCPQGVSSQSPQLFPGSHCLPIRPSAGTASGLSGLGRREMLQAHVRVGCHAKALGSASLL